MQISDNVGITFDDVLLAPGYSNIGSRESIDTSTNFLDLKLTVPIISSNMDFVTGSRMANAMWDVGGLGIIHRFCPWNSQYENMQKSLGPVSLSVGTRDMYESVRRVRDLAYVAHSLNMPAIVCIDVAHGHHEKVKSLIGYIRDENPPESIKIIAGNVATPEGAKFLKDAGADAIKVGIGPGSVCTTRVVTGIGVPQFSAIRNVAEAGTRLPIIADGGIKNSGDIVKALAAGADVVMLGSLLAGTQECPGEVIETGDGRKLRRYRGQSIFGVNGEKYTKEGVSGYIEEKGPVAGVIKQLMGGLRSGMSYIGAKNLRDLKSKAVFIRVSGNTLQENHPRISLTI